MTQRTKNQRTMPGIHLWSNCYFNLEGAGYSHSILLLLKTGCLDEQNMPSTNSFLPTNSPQITLCGTACVGQEELIPKQTKKEPKLFWNEF